MVLGEFKKKVMEEIKIGVVGLGYVGLPLARLFATKYAVVGFDLKKERIEALNRGIDRTLEVSEEVMKSVLRPSVPKRGEKGLYCSCDPEDLRDCNYYIITVPTPVDKHNRPDLTPLIRASETVGQVIVRGDIVIYESTVYPGATEEDCIPVIERVSGLKYNVDFFAGYSPERINPGDKQHTVEKIKTYKSFYNLYNNLLKIQNWREVQDSQIIQPEDSNKGDTYIIFLNKIAEDGTQTQDVKFLTTNVTEKEGETIETSVEPITVKEAKKLPITGESLALFIVLAVISIVATIVYFRVKKLKNENTKN